MYQQLFKLHADLLKALAHPKRLEIINLIRDKKFCCVGSMQEMLGLPQANISQHLMILRKSGVVKTKREGKKIFYQITSKKIIQACDLLREFLIKKFKNSKLADEFALNMLDLTPVVRDPVCQMRLSPKTASFAHKHKNKKYYFCASGCLKKFTKNIKKYL